MWQRADKVQVGGVEGSYGSVSAAAEDHVLRQRQTLARARLQYRTSPLDNFQTQSVLVLAANPRLIQRSGATHLHPQMHGRPQPQQSKSLCQTHKQTFTSSDLFHLTSLLSTSSALLLSFFTSPKAVKADDHPRVAPEKLPS